MATENRLKANSLSLSGAIAIGIALMAPAAGMMFVPPVVAQSAGAAVPLVYVIALIGCLFIANTIVQFSKRLPHAGSFFAYNSAGLGKTTGFVSGWLLFAGYVVFFPQNILAGAYFTQSIIKEHLGVNISWIVFAVIFTVVIWHLSYRGISTSMKADLYFVTFESIVIVAVVLFILFKGGDAGNTMQVFTVSASPKGVSGILFGMVFAVMTFMGFESSATVAEETKDPRRNIPRAIWGSVIGMGVFYVIVTYAMSIGFGVHHGAKFAANSVPLDYLATRFGTPWLTTLVDIAGIISALAVSIATNNAAVRLIFAMGREGVFPKSFAVTHSKYLTPTTAIHAVGAFALVISLACGIAFGPYPVGYGLVGEFGSVPIIVCYVLASASLVVFMRKHDARSFHWWVHGVAPVIGGLIMLLPLYGSIFPLPPWPYNLILGLVFVYIIAGIIIGIALKRKSSSLLDNLGELMASGDTTHVDS